MISYAIIGGLLVGTAASLLLLFNGRIMGASGIAGVFFAALAARTTSSQYAKKELFWRFLFVFGLIAGGAVVIRLFPSIFHPQLPLASNTELVVSGFLVGIGTRMGWGCTSGHGVCGMARLSGRSFIATLIFITAGVCTLLIKRML